MSDFSSSQPPTDNSLPNGQSSEPQEKTTPEEYTQPTETVLLPDTTPEQIDEADIQSKKEAPPPGKTPPPPPPLGDTPPIVPPQIGSQDMPLPPRHEHPDGEQLDNPHHLPPIRRPGSHPPEGVRPGSIPSSERPVKRPVRQAAVEEPSHLEAAKERLSAGMGCLMRAFLISLIPLTILLIAGATFAVYQYYAILATLPDMSGLHEKASSFETTRILDRNGNVLYEILDPSAGRRTYVPINRISPYLIAATVATEDKNYYKHPGFDWTAIVRAFWQNYQGGETVSGASTITQQLARMLLFSPEERVEKSYTRKVREALLAAELTRRYTKDEILELFLNENNYANLSYGVEAAAGTYFGTSASTLDLAQGAFVAGLPQSPAVYDIYTNREATLKRYANVLQLMVAASEEQDCIDVYVGGTRPQEICVDSATAIAAYNKLATQEFASPDVPMRYPHWVVYIKSLLEEMYDSQTIYRAGFTVYTTLDPDMQDAAQKIVSDQVALLAANNASNGALVAVDPSTGEILAMVGSADFNNEEIDGQVNMAITKTRQPGSSIKPLTYLAAFEKGWTPATLIWDVPTSFPPSGDPNDPRGLAYSPVNYDGRFHGPVSVRTALSNSYNIPAVKTLEFVGVYDNPNTPQKDGLIGTAERLGITSFTRNDYGLALTLGGGEVSLLEMAGAYSVFANQGKRIPPVAITRIIDFTGNTVYEYKVPEGEQVIRPEHAYLLSSILSDNDARIPMFGTNSILHLPFSAAAKTGTTNEFRDNWTMGYNPDLVVGVWIGNADNSPMINTTGLTGAAPIWAAFMTYAVPKRTGNNPTAFTRPAGIIDRVVCAASGSEPSSWCPQQRNEIFASDQPPLPADQDMWARIKIDTWTGLRTSPECGEQFAEEAEVLNITDPWAVKWITEQGAGQSWATEMGFEPPFRFAPSRACRGDDSRPLLAITSPGEGQTIHQRQLEIYGQAGASGANHGDFARFKLDFGVGSDPSEWKPLTEATAPINQSEKLYTWDLQEFPVDGPMTLRLRIESTKNGFAEIRIHVSFQLPTPTLIPTPTFTNTPVFTNTPLPSATALPSATPTVTPTLPPPAIPEPSATPQPGG